MRWKDEKCKAKVGDTPWHGEWQEEETKKGIIAPAVWINLHEMDLNQFEWEYERRGLVENGP